MKLKHTIALTPVAPAVTGPVAPVVPTPPAPSVSVDSQPEAPVAVPVVILEAEALAREIEVAEVEVERPDAEDREIAAAVAAIDAAVARAEAARAEAEAEAARAEAEAEAERAEAEVREIEEALARAEERARADAERAVAEAREIEEAVAVAEAARADAEAERADAEDREIAAAVAAIDAAVAREEARAEAAAVARVARENGVDVYVDNRPQRMVRAYTLLLEHQAHLSAEAIDQAYEEFLAAADNIADVSRRRNVRKVLDLDGFHHYGYYSLLANNLMVKGLNIGGKKLLGHLWYYASNYSEQGQRDEQIAKAKELAQSDIFSGLEASIEDDGHVVCNTGKLQRLAVSLLQGRLPGADIDNIGGDLLPLQPGEIMVAVMGAWAQYERDTPRNFILAEEYVQAFENQFRREAVRRFNEDIFIATLEAIRNELADD